VAVADAYRHTNGAELHAVLDRGGVIRHSAGATIRARIWCVATLNNTIMMGDHVEGSAS
jgi:hypothetical protein